MRICLGVLDDLPDPVAAPHEPRVCARVQQRPHRHADSSTVSKTSSEASNASASSWLHEPNRSSSAEPMFLPSPRPSGQARAPSEELQHGLVEGGPVAPCQLPDGPLEVVVEPSDCELIHTGHLSDSLSEAFRLTVQPLYLEVKEGEVHRAYTRQRRRAGSRCCHG